jgi:excisionase family DNA binding protein
MYLTVRETADRLRVSSSSVYLLVESGRLAHHRIGARRGAIRISENDLEAYLAQCRNEPTADTPARAPVASPPLKHIKVTR